MTGMKHKKYVVTGKIGSGKSSFIKILKEIERYDFRSADDDAKEIINKNKSEIDAIAMEIYGEEIDYRDVFFKDEILKERIENFVYKKLYKNYADLDLERDMFFEIPLYFESKKIADEMGFVPDKIIYIHSSPAIRHKRLMESRGMTEDDIKEREYYFVDDDYAINHADIIIENKDDYETLKERTLDYFAKDY